MTRLRYVLSILDARDRLELLGALGVLLLSAGGLGWTSAVHRAREARARECVERVRVHDAAWRARGVVAMRLSDPCRQ